MPFLSKDLIKATCLRLVFASRALPRVGLKLALSGCRSGSMATACALKCPSGVKMGRLESLSATWSACFVVFLV